MGSEAEGEADWRGESTAASAAVERGASHISQESSAAKLRNVQAAQAHALPLAGETAASIAKASAQPQGACGGGDGAN